MQMRRRMAGPLPYLGWLLLSAIGLAIACAVDPYIFAFAAFATAAVSALLALIAAWFGLRALGWALLAGLPSVLAFALLSTYRWA